MALRPQLLALLEDAFNGDVVISNEDESMVSNVDRNAYTGRLERCVLVAGEYYRVNCPYCNDTRKRLYINHRWGLKDPETASLNLFLATCFNEDCLKVPGRSWELYRMVFSPFSHEIGEDVLKPAHGGAPARCFSPPGRWIPLHELPANHPARLYVVERGFDPVMLAKQLDVGYCIEAKDEYIQAQGRIIIPVSMHGELKGWQARYCGDPEDKNIPKYFTMPGMKKTEVLYNFDRARRYPLVLICEGVTDVWAAGPTAVALFGKSLSVMQKALIGSTWKDGTAVVLLDGDAEAEARKILAELIGLVRQCVQVRLPGRADPGALPYQVLHDHVLNAAREQGVQLTLHSRENQLTG